MFIPNEIYFEIFNNFKRHELGYYLILSTNIRLVIIDILKYKLGDIYDDSLVIKDLQFLDIMYYSNNEFKMFPLDMCLKTKDIVKNHSKMVFCILNDNNQIIINDNFMRSYKINTRCEVKSISFIFERFFFTDYYDTNYQLDINNEFEYSITKYNKDITYKSDPRSSPLTNHEYFKNSKESRVSESINNCSIIYIGYKNNDLRIYKYHNNELLSLSKEFNNNIQCKVFNRHYCYFINNKNEFYKIYNGKDSYNIKIIRILKDYKVYKFSVSQDVDNLIVWIL
jgi:hypothetical protein